MIKKLLRFGINNFYLNSSTVDPRGVHMTRHSLFCDVEQRFWNYGRLGSMVVVDKRT